MNSATQLIKVDPNVCKIEYFYLHALNLFPVKAFYLDIQQTYLNYVQDRHSEVMDLLLTLRMHKEKCYYWLSS